MRLLDLFSGAGGCAVGYHRAGFTEIVGVDIKPQPRYPFQFVQGDALEYLAAHGREFDAIHASPPCQGFSAMTAKHAKKNHPDLVGPAREFLIKTGKPYIIENVPGAPLRTPVILCGTFFGLRVLRHRLFESNVFLFAPAQSCTHPPRGAVGRAGYADNKKVGDWISVAGHHPNLAASSFAMGIDWMNKDEISQAIPPAYTEYIGRQLLAILEE